jgi:hypothetical protein
MMADSTPAIGISKKNGQQLLVDMARVFVRLGLRPTIREGTIASLKLRQKAEWLRFAEVIGSSITEKQESLRKLRQLPETKRTFTIPDFEAVVACSHDGQKKPADIARITSVPANTIRDWLIRGQMPPVVKRHMAIQESTKHLPHSDVITYLFRDLGSSSVLARDMAAHLSLHAIQERVQQHAQDITTVYGDDKKIRYLFSPKLFSPLLGQP